MNEELEMTAAEKRLEEHLIIMDILLHINIASYPLPFSIICVN